MSAHLSFASLAEADPNLACQFRERVTWCVNALAGVDPYAKHRSLPTATRIVTSAEEIERVPQLLRQALRLFDTLGLDWDQVWWQRPLRLLPELCPDLVTSDFMQRLFDLGKEDA